MIALAKYKSSVLEQGKRILKSIGLGGSAMTTKECYPFGFDSQALENWTAVYAETSNRDEAVVVGYINKTQLAAAGESRMYSLDSSGQALAFVHCKADGILQLNGADFDSVRFGPLDQGLQAQNVLIHAELTKIAAAIGLLGGSYIVDPVTIEIGPAKSETVKIK